MLFCSHCVRGAGVHCEARGERGGELEARATAFQVCRHRRARAHLCQQLMHQALNGGPWHTPSRGGCRRRPRGAVAPSDAPGSPRGAPELAVLHLLAAAGFCSRKGAFHQEILVLKNSF